MMATGSSEVHYALKAWLPERKDSFLLISIKKKNPQEEKNSYDSSWDTCLFWWPLKDNVIDSPHSSPMVREGMISQSPKEKDVFIRINLEKRLGKTK
jgi:hypothetical protein